MDVMRREIEKEWLVAIVLDEVDGVLREHVGHVLVVPASRFAAGHVTDAADAVDDRVVVAVRRFHRQQIGPLGARWLVADFVLIADFDRIDWVEVRRRGGFRRYTQGMRSPVAGMMKQ